MDNQNWMNRSNSDDPIDGHLRSISGSKGTGSKDVGRNSKSSLEKKGDDGCDFRHE